TDRSRFFRGEVDKYSWVDTGSSYLPSELLAAYLWAQLEVWETVQARRRQRWERYDTRLAEWARQHAIRQPQMPSHCEQAYHIYYLLLPSLQARAAFIAHLRACGIL